MVLRDILLQHDSGSVSYQEVCFISHHNSYKLALSLSVMPVSEFPETRVS